LSDPDTIIKLATDLKAERQKRLLLEAKVVQNVRETSSGTMLFRTTRVTPKGQIYIIDKLRKEVA
jgi:hypothetical protein